jgi:hypothetical protein
MDDKTKKILAWSGVGLAVVALLHALGVIDGDTYKAILAFFGK